MLMNDRRVYQQLYIVMKRNRKDRTSAYNTSFYGLGSAESFSLASGQNTDVDPRYSYLYKGFVKDKNVRVDGHASGWKKATQLPQQSASSGPALRGMDPSPQVFSTARNAGAERFARNQRMTQPLVDYENEMSDMSADESDHRNPTFSGRPLNIELDSILTNVLKETRVTSEERIHKLINNLQGELRKRNLPANDIHHYTESYLGKLIKEKKWTSMTVRTALYLSVAPPITVEQDAPDAWFQCITCQFKYPYEKFTCPTCKTQHKSKPDLYVHELETHGVMRDPNMMCEFCYASFPRNPVALRTHFKVHHCCQFDHVECMFGCKTLILQTHSKALAEHVYSCHACIECDDLLSCAMDKHVDLFHGPPPQEDNPYQAPPDPMQTIDKYDMVDLAFDITNLRKKERPEAPPEKKRKKGPSGIPDQNFNLESISNDVLSKAKNVLDVFADQSENVNLADVTYNFLSASRKPPEADRRYPDRESDAGLGDDLLFSREQDMDMSGSYVAGSRQKRPASPLYPEGMYSVDPFKPREYQEATRSATSASRSKHRYDESPPQLVRLAEQMRSISPPMIRRKKDKVKEKVPLKKILSPRRSRSRSISVDRYGRWSRSPSSEPRSPRKSRSRSLSPVRHVKAIDRSASPVEKEKAPEDHGDKWTECKLCGFSCPPHGGFTCNNCDAKFLMETALVKHADEVHKIDLPIDTKCRFCEKECRRSSKLHEHLVEEHLCAQEHVQCEFGCSLLLTKPNYPMHLKNKHDSWFCENCKAITKIGKKCGCKKGVSKKELDAMLEDTDNLSDGELQEIVAVEEQIKLMKVEREHLVIMLSAESSSRINVLKERPEKQPIGGDSITKELVSESRSSVKEKGFFYCDACPLVYSPSLKQCTACDLMFLDVYQLALHAVSKHNCAMDTKDLECVYCSAKFDSYEAILAHRVTHFCSEHIECPSGCLKLIPGRTNELEKHLANEHGDCSAKPEKSMVIMANLSSDAKAKSQSASVLGTSNLTRCSECPIGVPEDFMLKCEKCSNSDFSIFYAADELSYHMATQHKKKVKGDFKCTICYDEPTFKNDIEGLMNHKYKKHKLCKLHVKCPKDKCKTLIPYGGVSSHLQKDCDFAKPEDLSNQPYYSLKLPEVKVCESCDFAAHVSKVYKCPTCDACIPDRLEFLSHLQLDHGMKDVADDFEYECPHCPPSSDGSAPVYSSIKWRQHRHDKHSICKTHFMCMNLSCSWMFESLSALKKHIKTSAKCRDEPSIETPTAMGPKACHTCQELVKEPVERMCVLCFGRRIMFVDNIQLSLHMTYVHKRKFPKFVTCPDCRKQFPNYAEYGTHRKNFHKRCPKHRYCRRNKNCPFVFGHKDHEIPHACISDSKIEKILSAEAKKKEKLAKATEEKPVEKTHLTCGTCGAVSNYRSKSFKCKESGCKATFLFANELALHQFRSHKMKVTGKFQCTRCPGNLVFTDDPYGLYKHMKETHGSCKYHKKCPTPGCSWMFDVGDDITGHISKCVDVYQKAIAPREAKSDKKSLKPIEGPSSSERKRARDRITGPAEMPKIQVKKPEYYKKIDLPKIVLYSCVDCSKKFARDTLFECTLCEESVALSTKRFVNLVYMNAHLKKNHKKIISGDHQCSVCSRTFPTDPVGLLKHQVDEHGYCENHYIGQGENSDKLFGQILALTEQHTEAHAEHVSPGAVKRELVIDEEMDDTGNGVTMGELAMGPESDQVLVGLTDPTLENDFILVENAPID